MRCFKGLLLLPFTLLSHVHAQDSTAILEAAIKELPNCAVSLCHKCWCASSNLLQLQCMISAVSKSSCKLSDFYCISRDVELNEKINVCVQANCTIREALSMSSLQAAVSNRELMLLQLPRTSRKPRTDSQFAITHTWLSILE